MNKPIYLKKQSDLINNENNTKIGAGFAVLTKITSNREA